MPPAAFRRTAAELRAKPVRRKKCRPCSLGKDNRIIDELFAVCRRMTNDE